MCVQLLRVEYEGIAESPRLEPVDSHDRAQTRDVGPKGRLRTSGRISAPELFDQHIAGGAAIASEYQQSK